MIDVRLHERWTPTTGSGYGERCRLRGIVAYWIGGRLLETRYYVHKECVQLMTSSLGEPRCSTLGEVGYDIRPDQSVSKEDIERYINEKIAPIQVMAMDGR